MALNLSLASKLSEVSFEFRSIATGTPITRTEDTDFEVVEYMETNECEDYVSCEVATTVFPALLRSQWPGSRPTIMVSRAKVIGYEGAQVLLSPSPTQNVYGCTQMRHETIMTSQQESYANMGGFIRSRNVGSRYIAGEL